MKISGSPDELTDFLRRNGGDDPDEPRRSVSLKTYSALRGELRDATEELAVVRAELAAARPLLTDARIALTRAEKERDDSTSRLDRYVSARRENIAAWRAAADRGDLYWQPDLLGDVDPGPYPPPMHVRHWAAANPLPGPDPEHTARVEEIKANSEGAFEVFFRDPAKRPEPPPAEPAPADTGALTPSDIPGGETAGGFGLVEDRGPDAPVTTGRPVPPSIFAEPEPEPVVLSRDNGPRDEDDGDGGVEPLPPFDEPPVPEITVRLLTPEERAEKITAATDAAVTAARAVKGDRTARAKPRKIGDPGANIGDGLDVFRVDGRALLTGVRERLLNAGASPDEIKTASAYTDLDFALLAERLEEIRADGRISDPIAALGVILGRPRGGTRSLLVRAASLGIMAGGQRGSNDTVNRLSAKGRALLTAHAADRMTETLTRVRDASTALLDTPTETTPSETDAPPAPEEPLVPAHVTGPIVPTAEQLRDIARLNAEGEKHVERLRAAAPKRHHEGATLPVRLNPVTNAKIPKEYRRLAGVARREGWAIGVSKTGHIEWHGPKGQRVVTSATPGGQSTISTELRALRAAGIVA